MRGARHALLASSASPFNAYSATNRISTVRCSLAPAGANCQPATALLAARVNTCTGEASSTCTSLTDPSALTR